MHQKFFWLIFTFMLSALAGCSSTPKTPKPVYTEQCCTLLSQYQLSKTLEKEGVQVIITGDEITLFLSTSQFFYDNSNRLRNTRDVLNHMIAFINTYPVVDLQVKGYTNNSGNKERNLALSRAQAEAIATGLWKHGLKGRLISAQGVGCQNPYGFNHVEVFFRLPPPDNVFH